MCDGHLDSLAVYSTGICVAQPTCQEGATTTDLKSVGNSSVLSKTDSNLQVQDNGWVIASHAEGNGWELSSGIFNNCAGNSLYSTEFCD